MDLLSKSTRFLKRFRLLKLGCYKPLRGVNMKTIDELKNEKGHIDSNAIKQIIPYEQPF